MNSTADETRETRLKRLTWLATRRGTKEADIVIGRFMAKHMATMTDDELDQWEAFLHVPDAESYPWILGKKPVPDEFNTPVFQALQASLTDHNAD